MTDLREICDAVLRLTQALENVGGSPNLAVDVDPVTWAILQWAVHDNADVTFDRSKVDGLRICNIPFRKVVLLPQPLIPYGRAGRPECRE